MMNKAKRHVTSTVTALAAAALLCAIPAHATTLFSDQFAPSTAGTDLTTYDSDYGISTTGGTPPSGYPVHEIAPDGSGAYLSTRMTGGNPGRTVTTLTNSADFTPTGPLGAYDGSGAGTFYMGALIDYNSLNFVRNGGMLLVGTEVAGQTTPWFGVRSINDGADIIAWAQQGGANVGTSNPALVLSSGMADANGDILLMAQWRNQTGAWDANNNLLLGINPTSAADLIYATGRTGNFNGTVTNNAAISEMMLRIETPHFPGNGGNPIAEGIIESVAFGTTYDDAIPTLFVDSGGNNNAVPEPMTGALALLGIVGLVARRRRHA